MKYLIGALLAFVVCQANWKNEREALPLMYQQDEFRIFYDVKGENALPLKNQKDMNNNNIPDYIENVGLRLAYSLRVYVDVLGFQHPFKSKRYEGVKTIDVHMLSMKSKGSAGDAIHTFNYQFITTPSHPSLSIKLSTDLRDDTMTPSHELFHIIQNGYTMFKNRWYTEGTARWSERIFEKGTGKRENLPQNLKELETLLEQSYDAKYFWRKLAYECDTHQGKFPYTSWMKNHVDNYPPLIKDTRIYGYGFIKTFFENLDVQDKIVSKKRGFEPFEWSEKEQKNNEKNNHYILTALKNTIMKTCIQNKEVAHFTRLIDQYNEGKNDYFR